ncbi:MAG: carboxypeptidase regulatory-like domain-containing protein [Planctomycetaceae bacterium]|nr:carboxypeptidase regulatory-like domain-containing protein [Planctomycetaceae bacterium]
MIRSRCLRSMIVASVCIGMLASQSGLQAAGANPKAGKTDVRPILIPKVMDVTLGEGGTLKGKFVDNQGKAIDAAPVMIVHKGKEVARTMTDAEGRFVIKNLRTGDHAICSAQYVQQARLWTGKNAPPSAKTESVIVAKDGVVRGQDGCCLGMGPDFLTLGLVALSVGAVVIGAITLDKVNDIENNLPPASP